MNTVGTIPTANNQCCQLTAVDREASTAKGSHRSAVTRAFKAVILPRQQAGVAVHHAEDEIERLRSLQSPKSPQKFGQGGCCCEECQKQRGGVALQRDR